MIWHLVFPILPVADESRRPGRPISRGWLQDYDSLLVDDHATAGAPVSKRTSSEAATAHRGRFIEAPESNELERRRVLIRFVQDSDLPSKLSIVKACQQFCPDITDADVRINKDKFVVAINFPSTDDATAADLGLKKQAAKLLKVPRECILGVSRVRATQVNPDRHQKELEARRQAAVYIPHGPPPPPPPRPSLPPAQYPSYMSGHLPHQPHHLAPHQAPPGDARYITVMPVDPRRPQQTQAPAAVAAYHHPTGSSIPGIPGPSSGGPMDPRRPHLITPPGLNPAQPTQIVVLAGGQAHTVHLPPGMVMQQQQGAAGWLGVVRLADRAYVCPCQSCKSRGAVCDMFVSCVV